MEQLIEKVCQNCGKHFGTYYCEDLICPECFKKIADIENEGKE